MSDGALKRAAVFAQVKSQAWTLVEAAERMELSYELRQKRFCFRVMPAMRQGR